MSPYFKSGFLGEEIKIWAEENKRKHVELFFQAEKINSDCYFLLQRVELDRRNPRKVLVACLFPRCLEFFQAVFHHAERGMPNSARVMLRALIESLFILSAVANDDEALDQYILNDELQRVKMINKAIATKDPSLAAFRTEQSLALKEELEKKIKEKNIKKLSTEEMARRAGLHDWYLTVYAETSRAVHGSVRDMEQYLVLDKDGEVKSIQFRPDDREVPVILATAGQAINLGLEQFAKTLDIDLNICHLHAAEFSKVFDE